MLVLLYMNICQHFLAKSSYYEVKICWEENYFFSGQSTEVRDLHHKLLCWCLFMYYSEIFNTLVIPLKNGDDIQGKAQSKWVDWSIINVFEKGFEILLEKS